VPDVAVVVNQWGKQHAPQAKYFPRKDAVVPKIGLAEQLQQVDGPQQQQVPDGLFQAFCQVIGLIF
jgi:hypothetical protein